MKLARKVRLYPTSEQEKKMYQNYGGMKFVYNWGLGKNIEYYNTTGKQNTENHYYNTSMTSKVF